jgi:chloramphenicol O-acetyltransferase type A
MRTLDKSTWKRREHFDFFSQCDEPFFGMVTEINCTKAYQISKSRNQSFFAYYLHKSLTAVNLVEELRFRIDGENIIVYDEIHASPTLGREDHTFGFSFVPFNKDFDIFNASLKLEIEDVRNSTGLRLNENATRKNVVHYSSIPWCTFSGLTHARNFKFEDSAPKISFGKMFTKKDQQFMNIAINVHHGLADGYHIAKYLDYFQKLMDGE